MTYIITGFLFLLYIYRDLWKKNLKSIYKKDISWVLVAYNMLMDDIEMKMYVTLGLFTSMTIAALTASANALLFGIVAVLLFVAFLRDYKDFKEKKLTLNS